MFKPLFALAAAAAVAMPALAQSVSDTHASAAGALSGRSPVAMLRPVAQADVRTAAVGIHVPAGKPHVYGRHEHPHREMAAQRAAANKSEQVALGN